jgi:hypothetical protein
MADEKDPFETFSSETMKRAEEMCSGLSIGLSLERRGRAVLYRGAIADLDDHNSLHVPVTVAEIEHDPGFTLILEEKLAPCNRALLVFRRPPSQDVKYIGHHKGSEPGKRGEEDQGKHVVRFVIDQQAQAR